MMSSALNQTLICHHFKEANSIAKGFFTFSGFIQTNWQNHCRLKAPVKSIFPSTASPRYIYIYIFSMVIHIIQTYPTKYYTFDSSLFTCRPPIKFFSRLCFSQSQLSQLLSIHPCLSNFVPHLYFYHVSFLN